MSGTWTVPQFVAGSPAGVDATWVGIGRGGQALAAPSGLGADGASFTVPRS